LNQEITPVKVNRRKIRHDSDTDFRADSDSDVEDQVDEQAEPANHELQQEAITLATDRPQAEIQGSQPPPIQNSAIPPTAVPVRPQPKGTCSDSPN
jgi:hypothetical protein